MSLRAARAPRHERAVALAREEILEAAAATFARAGFKGTTMNQIAQAAGYTAPTLYSYFRSKAEIFSALIEGVAEDCRATLRTPLPADLTFSQQLEIVLATQLDLAARRRNALAVFLAIRPLDEDVRTGSRNKTPYDAYLIEVAAWIRQAAKETELHHAVEDLAACLVGMVSGFVRRSLSERTPGNLTEQTRMLTDFFLHGAVGAESTRQNTGLRTS